MKRKYYYPHSLGTLFPFLQNICAKAPNYVTQLGITPADLSFLNLTCALCSALNDYQNRAKRFAEDWTGLRHSCFLGPITTAPPVWPAWTGPATAPIGLEAGCGVKLRAMIKRWKTAAGYNDPIGEDLGIVGPEDNVDPATAQPELRVALVAGHPEISAGLQGFDSVEFEVNRGAGFAMLDVSTGGPVVDNHVLPPPGDSDVWTYRGILRVNNARVGQWSLNVPVPVIGI